MIPYGRQDISEEDIQAVVDVLRSDFLTQGPAVPAFEQTLERYTGARHAVAVNSATSALHMACLAAGVGPGDWVWTSPVTFVASANCALYCGAKVDFVDIDLGTYNMSVEALAAKLEKAEKAGHLPKVVIPVHLCGEPCDMAGIKALSTRYGFRVIEDASHAIGARYRADRVGKCTYSDIAVFSFHPVKIITTGEGGMALTNDPVLAERMRLLRSHGITRNSDAMTKPPEGSWYYEQIELGYNYRMTDIQAALGLSQMSRIDEFLSRRAFLADFYDRALADLPDVVLPARDPANRSAIHLYVIRLEDTGRHAGRSRVFERLREAGIGVNVHYIPVYRQPYYQRAGFAEGYCPAAEEYYAGAISLPMFAGLTDEQQAQVVRALGVSLNLEMVD